VSARTVRAAVLVVGVGMLGGCYDFDAPLDPDPTRALDPALLGTWRCLPFDEGADQEPANFVFAASTRERFYSIAFEPGERFEAHASEVAGRSFLNVRQVEPAGQERSWMFARYAFLLPDVLHLELVKNTRLRGVEETSASLRAALERLDGQGEPYENFCVCVRAKTQEAATADAAK
jgi:hypothetical protein